MILELQDTQDGPHITPEIPRNAGRFLKNVPKIHSMLKCLSQDHVAMTYNYS